MMDGNGEQRDVTPGEVIAESLLDGAYGAVLGEEVVAELADRILEDLRQAASDVLAGPVPGIACVKGEWVWVSGEV